MGRPVGPAAPGTTADSHGQPVSRFSGATDSMTQMSQDNRSTHSDPTEMMDEENEEDDITVVSSNLSTEADQTTVSIWDAADFPPPTASYRQAAELPPPAPLSRALFPAPYTKSKLTMLSGGPGRGGGITLSAHKPQAASSLTMQAISRVSGSGSAGVPLPPRKKAATDQGLLLEIREMRISHAAQLERMSAQYRDENKRLSETIDNLQNTMQQLTENMRIMTTTASTRTSGEANIDLEEGDFIESPPRKNKPGKKSSLQNAMVPYSPQQKLTAKEQEESAKRARSRISSSPESTLQNKQQSNRYAALGGDPDDDNGEEEGMEYQDESEDEFREQIEKGTTEALDTAIIVAQSRTNKLRVDHLRTNTGTNPPKPPPGSGSNGAGTRK